MYKRYVKKTIETALLDTRVVLVAGPRQSGKTTLVQMLSDKSVPFFTLDNATTLAAAKEDPTGFIRGLDRAIIDEVQRVPELLLAIKESVDHDQRPGRFLLTGSTNLMAIPQLADSLAGRMEIVNLLPLAQCEINGKASKFLNSIFRGEIPDLELTKLADDLVDLVLTGGYPEAVERASYQRKQAWHLNYIDAIVQRDIHEASQIVKGQQMPSLLMALANQSAQLTNHSKIGALLDINYGTAQKYTSIFEQLFIIKTLPSWHTNRLKRLTKTPKLHFLDSGLLASLQGISQAQIKNDRRLLGPLLETFVYAELLKLSTWNEGRLHFSHYRDKQKNEVDIVIQNQRGQIVGIEVKATASVSSADFNGLKRLAKAHPKEFVMGIVLYDHDKIIPFGSKMQAVPISALWC